MLLQVSDYNPAFALQRGTEDLSESQLQEYDYGDENGNYIENPVSDFANTAEEYPAINDYENAGEEGDTAEWVQAYDDDNVVYWYNNYTGVSQYEDPGYGY